MTTETKIPDLPIVAEAYIENFTWPSHEAYVRAHEVMQATVQAVLQSPEVQARQWQPIATAPKDGTDIMLSDGTYVTVGHWHYEAGGTTEYRDLDGRWVGQDDRDEFAGWVDWMGGITPTHWMPLLAPPSDTAEDAKP